MTDTRNPKPDDAETLHRKARLRELLAHCFGGKQSALQQHIEYATGKKPNQGELSQILKDNSGRAFGDDKARTLTEAIGLHRRWFEMPLGTHLRKADWMRELPGMVALMPTRTIEHRRAGPNADQVMQTIAGVAALAGIPLAAIMPDPAAARARISIALGEFSEEQTAAGIKQSLIPSIKVDMSAPAPKAKPISKAGKAPAAKPKKVRRA